MTDKTNKPIDRLTHTVKKAKRIRHIINLVKLSVYYNIESMHVRLSKECIKRLEGRL